MNFAALSPTREMSYLVRALVRKGHRFGTAFVDPTLPSIVKLDAFDQVLPIANQWEQLLHEPVADALLIGTSVGINGETLGETAEKSEQLRRLVQSGLRLIIEFPACEALLGFELQMIQRDSQALVVPYFPGLYSQANDRMRSWAENPDTEGLGALQQISIQRFSNRTTRLDMLAIFARDAALIRNWLGRIERLSALRPQAKGTGSDDEWSGLSVQMTDAVGRVAQWTLWRDDNAVESGRAAEFVMQGTKGRLVAQPTAARPFHLILRETPAESISQSIPAGEETDAASREDDDEAGTLLKLLANANHAEQVWENACRAVELAETIEISARRNKTIQLFHEEHSELSTFKSVMAAGGCLTLLAVLALIPLLVLADRVFPGLKDHASLRNAPWYVLAIFLVVFLASQAMIWLAGKKPPRDP